MDSLTLASSFATIIGLLCNFSAERQSTSDDEYQDFLAWLDEKRHNDLRTLIASDKKLSHSIHALLSQNHEIIIAKLESLDSSLASVAAHLDGFKDIALAVRPNCKLSDQAVSILRQLYDSGGSKFLEIKHMGGGAYQILDATMEPKQITPQDPRFLEDDLLSLCEFGFLRQDFNSRGSRLFHITRPAATFITSVT